MMKKTTILSVLLALSLSSGFLFAQKTITIRADDYNHTYEGVGTSFGISLGAYFQMTEENQRQAAELLHEGLDMEFLQTYMFGDPRDPEVLESYQTRFDFIKQAKKIRPKSKVSLIFDNFPDYLRTDFTRPDGEVERILDFEREGIYKEVAEWYIDVLEAYKREGIEVDILSCSNEPNFRRQYLYGHGDPRIGLAFILKEAVPIFKALLQDKEVNTLKLKTPEIMGPNTISTGGGRNYIRYWNNNFPEAYEEIDIVSTHQYGGGLSERNIGQIRDLLEGRKFYQNEQHGYHSDNLGLDQFEGLAREVKTILDLSALYNVATNNGVQAWFYFQANNPRGFVASSLIRTPRNGDEPTPYLQYNAFRQMTSQPLKSRVLGFDSDGIDARNISAFRKEKKKTVYINISNFSETDEEITVDLRDLDGMNYRIKSIKYLTTDADSREEVVIDEKLEETVENYTVTSGAFSVNTLIVKIDRNTKPKKAPKVSVETQTSGDLLEITSNEGGIAIRGVEAHKIREVKLYDLSGNSVGTAVNIEGEDGMRFSDLKPGIYVIKIEGQDGTKTTRKIYSN